MNPSQRYFGKYRGKVAANVDPEQRGRVQVAVPAVLGDSKLCWAMPCVPYAGPGVGLFLLPPRGANVWVEFEGGDPDYPIWTGCFWGTGECPAMPAIVQNKVLKTGPVTLTMNDLKGLELEVALPGMPAPIKLTMNQAGMELSAGKAKIKLGPVSVNVNDGALEVI